VSERALHLSNGKTRLYTDQQSTELGEIKVKKNRKVKRKMAATLSDIYPSTCLTWEALPRSIKTPANIAIPSPCYRFEVVAWKPIFITDL